MLSHRIAQRFSLEPQAVMELISKGRFRVKNRVSDEVARKLGEELQGLGAIVSIVDAEGQPPPTAEESAMSLKFQLDELDTNALVALDGSASEAKTLAAEAFAPPDAPDALDDEQWAEYLFMRSNTRGAHRERWVHSQGCRRWFNVCRDTVSHEILAVYAIGAKPPALEGRT